MEEKIKKQQSSANNPKHAVWDCGSSLYDSFELKSFEKQLDAAISSRSLSMPHLSDRRLFPPPPPPPSKKTPSKMSRSLQRLIRSVFKLRNKTDFGENHSSEGFFIVYDRSGSLSTIPEGPEFHGLSPEIRSLVRRTASERFTDMASIGVC
ncbi:hypothetical protein PHJA_000398300 [Phtheirospermum japonicum]|uniref:Uncharacterized protein n=1 Tax=Phtheirospermum japonicum TaxID=374723 RepID=A0A830BE38_9LAMI|nr:hypothetical protein PHJA_000398300 [Phtheirospermum japonicum]